MTVRTGAIVLAGGRSSRFGRDKLAEPIDGRPLLHHAIAAVRAITAEIVVVVAPGDGPTLPGGVRVVHDAVAFEGPLAGLAAGLTALDPAIDRVIVVAGDMPTLVPAVLERLLDALGDGAGASILEAGGQRAVLPLGLMRETAAVGALLLLDSGQRRLGAMLDVLEVYAVPQEAWRSDDPGGLTLRDVDTREDL